MLRFILIALVVANLAYFVWASGDADGAAGAGDREPQRLAQQLRPQLLQIRKAGAPTATPESSPAAGSNAPR